MKVFPSIVVILVVTMSNLVFAGSLENFSGKTYTCAGNDMQYQIKFGTIIEDDTAFGRRQYAATVNINNRPPETIIIHQNRISTRCESGWKLSIDIKSEGQLLTTEIESAGCSFSKGSHSYLIKDNHFTELKCSF